MKEWEKQFMPDDFDRIYQKYFARLKQSGSVRFDPSGWLNTFTEASNLYEFGKNISGKEIIPYYSDYHDQLSAHKESITKLLSVWDNYKYSNDEYTLCSSVTLGSLIVLAALMKKNVRTVFFETPAYFASISQAKSLGMNSHLIPTYLDQNFSLKLNLNDLKNEGPFVLWVTQPRMSLGINQDFQGLKDIYNKMPEDSYIVIDEATEQLFPSQLREFNPDEFPRIIKIRNFYKGMGINGIRLSFIAHHKSLQSDMQRELENFQGAIDYFSLSNITHHSQNIDRFKAMMDIANQQTKSLRSNIARRFENEFITVNKLENGYIGSISVDLSGFKENYRTNRENLLKYCFEHGMPIIVGATMKFAYHDQREFIRINYFKPAQEIEGAMEILTQYFEQSKAVATR